MRKKLRLWVVWPAVVGLILFSMAFVPLAGVKEPVLQLYNACAVPETVHFGVQPLDSPLVISGRVSTGGAVSRIDIDLGKLSGALYYDPLSDGMLSVDKRTPLYRVYEIDGEEAYLIKTGSRYEYNEYRTSVTHKIVRGEARPTNKWQVELPDTGHNIDNFNLRVSAVNSSQHGSTKGIPLRVVNDYTGPSLSGKVRYLTGGLAARPGDDLLVEISAQDDLSGVFSVRIQDGEGVLAFRENRDLDLEWRIGTEKRVVRNRIRPNIQPGTYQLQLMAVDRAGNEVLVPLEVIIREQLEYFHLEMKKGWNLISVPCPLVQPRVTDLFANDPFRQVYSVIGGQYLEPEEILPGLGYLVEAEEDFNLVVQLAENDISRVPLTVSLGPGWNLIGYASAGMEPSMSLTFYLGSEMKGSWVVIYNEKMAQARAKATSPYVWASDAFPTVNGRPFSEDSDNLPVMEIGQGYWIYLTDEGILVP